jgi:DNA-binding beta-propeller fold protein YncE
MYIPDTIYSLVRKVDVDGIITRVAGTGVRGYDGDDKAATEAMLYHPMDAVADAAGNVFVTDNFGHRIRKIDPSGTITTFAGTGTAGFGGDGGPASAAQLWSPTGLALDEAGNLYVADTGNHRIRRIDTSGTITTIAGIGVGLYLADEVPAIVAPLKSPQGISIDGEGTLWIADTGNQRIRTIDSGGFIHTVAGSGVAGNGGDGGPALAAQLAGPKDVAAGPDGTFYIADWSNNRVRAVGPDGVIRAFAGSGALGFLGDGGPATESHLGRPAGVAVGPDGAVYLVDQFNSRIRRVS